MRVAVGRHGYERARKAGEKPRRNEVQKEKNKNLLINAGVYDLFRYCSDEAYLPHRDWPIGAGPGIGYGARKAVGI